MKKETNVWMLTHDQYIDRRIFFFAEVFREYGCNIKLFADQYYDVFGGLDLDYVIRPEEVRIVREYNVDEHRVEKKDVDNINRICEQFLLTKGSGVIKKVDDDYLVQKINNNIIVSWRKGDDLLAFNKATGKYFVFSNAESEYDLLLCVRSIIDYLRGEIIISNINDNVYYGDISMMKTKDESGDELVHAHNRGSNYRYVYNREKEILFEYSPIKNVNKSDSVNGALFDYEDFKTHVYDYSKILNKVVETLAYEVPDVIYVADLPTLPIAIMLKKIYGCNIVMDCHEWWAKNCELWSNGDPIQSFLSDEYEKKLYPQCDLVITVGNYLGQKMEEHIQSKFEVIYSCMDMTAERNLEYIDLKSKFNLKNTDKIAIFQGGMSSNRNLENLARATKYMDDDCFLLLLTTGGFQEEFKEILFREGNADRVIWGGWINQDQLLNYTRSVDLGIIPYTAVCDYAECFVPNKMTEYFMARIPVLYDKSLKELEFVLGKNGVGYGADLTDARKFGELITYLLHNDSLLLKYRSAYNICGDMLGYRKQRERFVKMINDYRILG